MNNGEDDDNNDNDDRRENAGFATLHQNADKLEKVDCINSGMFP